MVRDGAQLYTMEGIAAGLIMLITAYLVLGSTSVYTPGDTHLTDMQLEQVGSDILRVMDTPLQMNNTLVNYQSNRTDLELIVDRGDSSGFYQQYREMYLNSRKVVAEATTVGGMGIQINSTIWYRRYDNTLGSYLLATPPDMVLRSTSGKEPGVRVTRWVHLNRFPPSIPPDRVPGNRTEPQEVLMEVVMWKV